MSNCNTCGKSFGFFTKELGCPKCNKVFCKKCLVYKIAASDNPKKTIWVCLRCSKVQEDPMIGSKNKKPPLEELLAVKPEELAIPILEPSTSNEDNSIRSRLDELKGTNNPEMTVEDSNIDDIQKRLAELKGVDYKKPTDKILFSKDSRTEQEKIDDLLKQFVEERDINQQYTTQTEESSGSIDDIERRLALLRGQDVSKIKAPLPDYSDETEQEELDRTIMQYLEEAKLPDLEETIESEFMKSIPKPENKKDIEELPFCEICNEDAVIRCLECENIFCHRCFLEFHEEEDYKTHKTKPYQAPKESGD
ncbi:abscission/NoCut checkpoint regulator [Chironomus tepperi]|uniref:abscission/NoCut checkpoint regulator n=1 Tax=Chironomus tepperi TaxID=113505 RepID=UPI00391F54E8